MRYLAGVALLGAFVSLGWGVYTYRLETRPARPVEVESPERDLGEYPVGKSQIAFRITNPTDRPAEVISVPECCGRACCIKPTLTDRLIIPPGASVDVVCELLVTAPKQFEVSGSLFLNDNGLRAVKLTVRGVGVAPGAGDAPPKQ
jgi:hypothetical protein